MLGDGDHAASGTDVMTPQEILLAAVDYIEQHGWCQGQDEDSAGRVCALSAIRKVPGAKLEIVGEAATAMDMLANIIKTPYIEAWNDMPSRTEREVIAAFREAAKTNG